MGYTQYNSKLGAVFPELRDVRSAMSGMAIVSFDFLILGDFPCTLRYFPQNWAAFLKWRTQAPTERIPLIDGKTHSRTIGAL